MGRWESKEVTWIRGLATMLAFTLVFGGGLPLIANFTPWMFR